MGIGGAEPSRKQPLCHRESQGMRSTGHRPVVFCGGRRGRTKAEFKYVHLLPSNGTSGRTTPGSTRVIWQCHSVQGRGAVGFPGCIVHSSRGAFCTCLGPVQNPALQGGEQEKKVALLGSLRCPLPLVGHLPPLSSGVLPPHPGVSWIWLLGSGG